MLMFPAVAAGAAVAWLAWTLFRFIRADADLALLSRPPPPPDAWRGKVVWVVGASQVKGLPWTLACAAVLHSNYLKIHSLLLVLPGPLLLLLLLVLPGAGPG